MDSGPEADLHWLAFLYVQGELAGDEAMAFEARLADDQAAREAVFGASELAGALALVVQANHPAGLPKGRSRLSRMRPWAIPAAATAAAAAAACLAMAILGHQKPNLARNNIIGPQRPSMRAVALAWSNLRREERAHPPTLPSWFVDSQPSTDAELVPFHEGVLSKPPPWLLIATARRTTAGQSPSETNEE